MPETNCVFCSIIKKQIPALVVYEDSSSLSFLDINPRSTGMTLVVSKTHYATFDENIETSSKIFQAAQTVGQMIKQSLNPQSIDFSVIPSKEVQHFHIRVYPVYENEIPLIENQPKKVTEQELKETAEKIRSVKIETPSEKVEEPPREEAKKSERSEEDIEYIRRESGL